MQLQFVEILGEGAQNRVYLVRYYRNSVPMLCALKYGTEQERVCISKLHHDHIIKLVAMEKVGRQNALLFEYVEGMDVERLLRRERPQLAATQEIIRAAASGLAHAHEKKILHRDIKLSNLMLSKHGVTKIADFGRARPAEVIEYSHLKGSLRYLAPELLQGSPFSEKSDVYSLGMCFLELQSPKVHLFPKDETIHRRELFRQTASLPHKEILREMLAFAPSERPTASNIALRLSQSDNRTLRHYAQKHIPALIVERAQHYQHVSLPPNPARQPPRSSPQKWLWLLLPMSILAAYPLMKRNKSQIQPIDPPKETTSSLVSPPMEAPPKTVTTTQKTIVSTKRTPLREQPKPLAVQSIRLSSVPWGATVWVDGIEIGKTLISEQKLTLGQHTIKMQMGEKSIERDVVLTAESLGYIWHVKTKHWKRLESQ